MKSELMQFFEFAHLPPKLQAVSQPFCLMADRVHNFTNEAHGELGGLIAWVETDLPSNQEATWALLKLQDAQRMLATNQSRDEVLRKVLEAKDCAVRAFLFKPVAP